ncbi:MAG: YdcF family protein [Sphingomonas sp.]
MIRFLYRLTILLIVAYLLGYALFAVLLPRPAGMERTDAIVVLTGGTGRLDRGFDLMRRGLARRMLISGVDPAVRAAELADAYRVEARLIDCCVDLERQSFDTRSNADQVTRWMSRQRYRSMRLVTNDLHMPRASHEIRSRIGDDVTIIRDAVPTSPGFRELFIEYNKFLLGWTADRLGI